MKISLPFTLLLISYCSIIQKAHSQDTIAPIIYLNKSSPFPIELSCTNNTYVDAGATAVDDRAPFNLTTQIIVSSNVNTRRPGKYYVKYEVSDVAGNTSVAVREVIVSPTKFRGFQKVKITDDLDLYYTDRSMEFARVKYQWYVDGAKVGQINTPDSIYVFHELGKNKIVNMEEWFCDGDTSLFFNIDNESPKDRTIKGRLNIDNNKNCTMDAGDNQFNTVVNLYNQFHQIVRSANSSNGAFIFEHLDSGKYVMEIDKQQAEILLCDSVITCSTTDTINDGFTFNANCLYPISQDPRIKSVYNSFIVPGRRFSIGAVVSSTRSPIEMDCQTSPNKGKVRISLEGKVHFLSIGNKSLSNYSVNGNSVEFNIDDFNTLNPNSLELIFKTDSNASRNDLVKIKVKISATDEDKDTLNNTNELEIPVRTSMDPNAVELYPSIVEPNFNDKIRHTIHFQNTGSFKAFNIIVRDTLDPNIDPNSFELVYASHPVVYARKNNALTFYFEDIMLPDSNSNEPESHGTIVFLAQTNHSLLLNDSISNFADIYFDYNAPVRTNKANLSVEEKPNVSIDSKLYNKGLNIYPNPGSGILTFQFEPINDLHTAGIYSIYGQLIAEVELINGKANIDSRFWPNGVYYIKAVTENQTIKAGFIIQN